MPQSREVHTKEIEQISEHTAEAAAVQHSKTPHLSAHEQTEQAKEHTHDTHTLEEKLHHGKEASDLAKK